MRDLARWERRFATNDYVFGTAPNAFLARQAALLEPGMTALSIADGEGRNGVWLAENGLDVLSQDFSPTAQAKARKLAQARGVALRFELSDVTKREWVKDACDVIVGIFFQFLAPAERERVFAGIRRTLKPGGLLLMEGYGPKQILYGTGGAGKIENLYRKALLEKAFGDFSECTVKSYDADISEGAGHAGISALVDLVARK